MSDLQKPEYKHADLIAGGLVLGSLIIFGAFGRVSGLINWGIGLLEISFLGAIWAAACRALGGPIFRFFLCNVVSSEYSDDITAHCMRPTISL